MELYKIAPCSRAPNTFDLFVGETYDAFLDAVEGAVTFKTRTKHLSIFTFKEKRWTVKKADMDGKAMVKLTTRAESETNARNLWKALAEVIA